MSFYSVSFKIFVSVQIMGLIFYFQTYMIVLCYFLLNYLHMFITQPTDLLTRKNISLAIIPCINGAYKSRYIYMHISYMRERMFVFLFTQMILFSHDLLMIDLFPLLQLAFQTYIKTYFRYFIW